jgi:copper transport protein
MRNSVKAVRRYTLLLLFCATALMGMTGIASAHAQLEGSDPPGNAVLASAPQWVTLSFGEPVEAAPNAIQVFDDHLERIDTRTVNRVASEGNRIQVGLPAELRRGTYTVSWHVSSSDTHPVSGTFRFSVGAPSEVTGKVPGVGRNDSAGLLLGVMRGLGYLGLVLAPGVLLVTSALWPAGLALSRTRRMMYLGLVLLCFSALGSMLLQGVWASARPLSAMWSAPTSLDTHSRKFDTIYAVRFYLLVIFGVILMAAVSAEVSRAARAHAVRPVRSRDRGRDLPGPRPLPAVPRSITFGAISLSTIALVGTWTLAGHAAAGIQTPAAVVADLLHVLAMSVWLGGLTLLTVVIRPADRLTDLAVFLPRFSRLAFGCVVVLVATGSYQTWREVGSWDALLGTTFGRVLLVKVAVVLAALMLANLARRWVHRHLTSAAAIGQLPRLARSPIIAHAADAATLDSAPTGPAEYGPREVRRLRLGLAAELGVAIAVLSITAAMVVTIPGRQSFIRPFNRTLAAPGLVVAVRVDAPRVGDTVLHLAARTPKGNPIAVTGIRASISEPVRKLGPLPVRLPTAGGASVNGREDIGLTFPAKGNWTVKLTVQTSPLDATAFTVIVSVT